MIRCAVPVAAGAFLASAAGVHATTSVAVDPAAFSPHLGRATISVQLDAPRKMSITLVSARGRRLGWIARPHLRRGVRLTWSGRLHGASVPDGSYRVVVRAGGKRVASAPVVVDSTAPLLRRLHIETKSYPFSGDARLVKTVSPTSDGLRDFAFVKFRLSEPATVTVQAYRTRKTLIGPIWGTQVTLSRGKRAIAWTPARGTPPREYALRVVAVDQLGNTRIYGRSSPGQTSIPRGPVVRVQGVDASFRKRSYAPGQRATLRISTDARQLSMQIFQAGPETEPTFRNDEMKGVAVEPPHELDWRRHARAPGQVTFPIGNWRSGLYFARIIARDGRRGYAPFVVRPTALGTTRVAVVIPTNTWEAYNFRDVDGDGWGDTWYAADSIASVDLRRPHLDRGVPYRFRSYDLAFLRWLYARGHDADFLSDDDLDSIESGDALAAAYDLVVFEGHEEYVTTHMYDVVERYRDLGGNLMFLSANNFFWQVERRGERIVRTEQWRALGRPEARLIGAQYLANDNGSRQKPYVVTGADTVPWAFQGTGLGNGATFGLYGIEIDATTPDSPPGTAVLATIPDAFGPGRTAQMTYYVTPAGAKVFDAGALNFGGSVWPVGRVQDPALPILMDNLWAQMTAP
jgi:hypothetical protein